MFTKILLIVEAALHCSSDSSRNDVGYLDFIPGFEPDLRINTNLGRKIVYII